MNCHPSTSKFRRAIRRLTVLVDGGILVVSVVIL